MSTKKSLFTTLKEMNKEDKKKLQHTLILTISTVMLLVGCSLLFFSCKAQPEPYKEYEPEIEWVSVLKDSTWTVQTNQLNTEPFPEALKNLSKIVFLTSNSNTWTCRLETTTGSDECSIALDKDTGSLTYGPTKLDVKLSESSGTYYMRLTGAGNKICDLVLEN